MGTLLQTFRNLNRTRKILVICAILAGVVAMVAVRRPSAGAQGVLTVTRGSISQTVSVTGRVKAAEDVQLSFQNSGRVAQVNAQVGDQVTSGQVLASLDNAELSAQLRDSQASLLAQQATLNDLLDGARPEDIEIAETGLNQTQQELQNQMDSAVHVLQTALADTDSAVHSDLDPGIFNDVGTVDYASFKLTFSCSSCGQADLTVNQQRGDFERDLDLWRADITRVSADASGDVLVAVLRNASQYISHTMNMLDNLGVVLNHPTVSLEQDTAATYRGSLASARVGVGNAQSAVADQLQFISTDQLNVSHAQAELTKLRNGSTPNEIIAQRAKVLSAQAQVDRINAQIAKNVIKSPIDGIVTVEDAKVGQNATANVSLVSVISDQALEIEANVPEVDIGKVASGDAVTMTVDALPGETFHASVASVDPAETIIDGVVNYKVTLRLTQPDDGLKSGLTVNLDIDTIRKDDVLLLPQYAVIENDQGTFVEKITGTTSVQVPVVVGIRSKDGTVEIVSGLQEGDMVQNIGLKQ